MRWNGYGENIWGLTASDGSADVELDFAGEMRRFRTYSARGIGRVYSVDDGTMAPRPRRLARSHSRPKS